MNILQRVRPTAFLIGFGIGLFLGYALVEMV